MSYLALYRKYRPQNFNDFVGQKDVADIIKKEIINKKISHAYLFSGPRGTGKTSTAKIIARMINCSNLGVDGVPCGECDSCINFNSNSDIVEIDAASNNGVDEIRELRDKVNLVPTYGKYKIYIIDEVHMLTTQAFNALLKTLEEPPNHVIFILATTEFHKIPITVVSRCQKFQFLKFSIDDIVLKLREIADFESINVDDNVLYEIARLADGGLRDAINMLDQLSSFKDSGLSVNDVYSLNGVISYEEFKELLNYVFVNDISSIVSFFENIDKCGKNFERFIDDLISFLKDILIYQNVDSFECKIKEKLDSIVFLNSIYSGEHIYKLIIILNDISVRIKNSSFSKILLITEFIKFSNELSSDVECKVNNNLVKKDKNELVVNPINGKDYINIKHKINQQFTVNDDFLINDKLKKIRINNSFATASKEYKEKFMENWNNILDKISSNLEYASISGLISDIDVLVVGEKNVIFLAQYDSLLERLLSQISVIEKFLLDVFNIPYKVIFLLKDEWEYEKKKYINNLKSSYKYSYIDEEVGVKDLNLDNKDDDIEKIISIFGDDVIKYK